MLAMVGRWGWAPLLSLHGHVKVAFYRETPEGVRRGGWHSSSGGGGGGGRLKKRGEDMSRLHLRDDEHRLCFLGIKAEMCTAGIRPSEKG